MGHPGGARNPSDPRFLSLFNVFEVQQPAGASLRAIYQAILTGHLTALPSTISEALGESLTDATMELFAFICDKLPPTPSRFHYVFNLRDLSRVYEVCGGGGVWWSCSVASTSLACDSTVQLDVSGVDSGGGVLIWPLCPHAAVSALFYGLLPLDSNSHAAARETTPPA
jgi:hypothetical protein